MYVINRMPQSIDIGFTGETAFRKVEIDMTPWLEQNPDGIPSIVAIRPGETAEDAYIAATTLEENILTWVITAGDIGPNAGDGLMQIWLEETENNSAVKRGKSVLVRTRVNRAINDASEEVPAAQEAWMEQMTALKDAIVNGVEAVKGKYLTCTKIEDAQVTYVRMNKSYAGYGLVVTKPADYAPKVGDLLYIKAAADINQPSYSASKDGIVLLVWMQGEGRDPNWYGIQPEYDKTYEVLNIGPLTDETEGRTILSKSMVYAFRYKDLHSVEAVNYNGNTIDAEAEGAGLINEERMTTQDAEHAIYHLQFYYDDDGDLCQTD